ncbi:MAG: phosphoribosyltransferase family protein [Actinomycetota bacterium]|nr:phosphoribosyltransferase family protein [Actinomycetota bacterium]MDP2289501.1 phosphoribosyltransferase family protein [Actinomycetota bacterium]
MTPYSSFTEVGRLLGVEVLALGPFLDPCVIGLNARGQLVGSAVAIALGVPLDAVAILKSGGSVTTTQLPETVSRTVVVVDDGVESGTAARAVGRAIRASGASSIVLAVPVCPAQQLGELAGIYDQVVVLHVCTDQLPLAGHYLDFDLLS